MRKRCTESLHLLRQSRTVLKLWTQVVCRCEESAFWLRLIDWLMRFLRINRHVKWSLKDWDERE